MNKLFFVLAVALLISPTCALSADTPVAPPAKTAKPAAKKNSHTVSQLAAYALKNGRKDALLQVVEPELGYSDSKPANTIDLKLGKIRTLSLSVRYEAVEGKNKPLSLVWRDSDIKTLDGKEHSDMWSFRSDLDGKLEAIAHAEGIGDDVDDKSASISDETAAKFIELKKSLLAAPFASLTK